MPREKTNFIAGVLTGALVGASLAMALAPAPEAEMREVLRAKARDVAARAQGAIDHGLPQT